MQASMAPPAKVEAAAAVTTTPGKPTEMATTKAAAAARPTTLLDVQEVEWITRELERLLAREQQSSDGGVSDDGGVVGQHRRKRARVTPAPAASAHKGVQGFLADLLGRHAVSICSGDAGVGHGSASDAARDRGRRRGRRAGFREVEKV